MPPIPLLSSAPSPPRLEFFQNGSNELHRITIDHSPFRIGRCETSDLRIDSAQVSREHAQIYQRGGLWSIRDLGSTNGTQVNGQTIHESFLSDGDILVIAETEVTFVASAVTPFQRMATQPMQPRVSTKLPALLPHEILQMRALTEATLWQSIPLQMATVISNCSGQAEACFVDLTESESNPAGFSTFHGVVGKHYRSVARRLAIEMAEVGSTANRIFLAADISEFELPEELLSSFEQLRNKGTLGFELGVSISLPEILDTTALEHACREVHKAQLLLGLVNFKGNSGRVLELAACSPDYLVLSDKMLTGATANSQALRRLELVLTTCQQVGIKAVLPHGDSPSTLAQCQQLGCEFAMQTGSPSEKADHHNVVCLAS